MEDRFARHIEDLHRELDRWAAEGHRLACRQQVPSCLASCPALEVCEAAIMRLEALFRDQCRRWYFSMGAAKRDQEGRQRIFLTREDYTSQVTGQETLEQHAIRRENARELVAFLEETLTARQLFVLVRHYWLGDTQEQAAELLGISQPGVSGHLKRAEKKLCIAAKKEEAGTSPRLAGWHLMNWARRLRAKLGIKGTGRWLATAADQGRHSPVRYVAARIVAEALRRQQAAESITILPGPATEQVIFSAVSSTMYWRGWAYEPKPALEARPSRDYERRVALPMDLARRSYRIGSGRYSERGIYRVTYDNRLADYLEQRHVNLPALGRAPAGERARYGLAGPEPPTMLPAKQEQTVDPELLVLAWILLAKVARLCARQHREHPREPGPDHVVKARRLVTAERPPWPGQDVHLPLDMMPQGPEHAFLAAAVAKDQQGKQPRTVISAGEYLEHRCDVHKPGDRSRFITGPLIKREVTLSRYLHLTALERENLSLEHSKTWRDVRRKRKPATIHSRCFREVSFFEQ